MKRLLTRTAVLLAMSVAAVAPMGAHAGEPEAVRIGSAVDRAAPVRAGDQATLTRVGDRLTAGVGGSRIDVPSVSGRPVTITTKTGAQVSMGVPAGTAVRGVKTGTGTVVYPDGTSSADVAVQALANGAVRATVTIGDAGAPTAYRFPIDLPDGTFLRPAAGGSGAVEITDGRVVYGAVEAPWARDGRGASVATRYAIEGDTLVQTVDHRAGTAYPVVADPTISFGWFIYVRFSRSEVQSIPNWVIAGGSVAVADYACNMIPHLALRAACKGASWLLIGRFFTAVRDAKSNNQCVELKYNYSPQLLVDAKRYSC